MADVAVLSSRIKDIGGAPGPRGMTLVGVAPYLRSKPLKFVLDVAWQYPGIARLDLGMSNLFMLNDPELVQQVLHDNGSNYRKSRFYTKLEPFFGKGLITSNGAAWRRERQVSQPAFSGPNLKLMVDDMVGATEGLLRRWEKVSGPIDVAAEMMRLTLRIALKTLFSAELADAEIDRLHDALTAVLRTAERRLWAVTPLPEIVPTGENRRFHAAIKIIDEIVYGLIAARRGALKHPADLFSLLLAATDENGKPYTDKSLRDQISSVLIAGHETTASALAWTWCLLSRHPDVERKLRSEIVNVLGPRRPDFDDLDSLVFTKMVFEESMRLYPPIWTMSREAIADDELGGYRIPADTAVMVCPYSMHRDERFWVNPEGFDPERFRPGQEEIQPRYAYFPFGGGPRMCIGSRFALMEARIILPMIAQRFHLHLLPGHVVEPLPMISLRPKYGMMMRLQPVT